jgi:hypothetical protein
MQDPTGVAAMGDYVSGWWVSLRLVCDYLSLLKLGFGSGQAGVCILLLKVASIAKWLTVDNYLVKLSRSLSA